MVIGRLPFSSPFKDDYHRQRMLRHIQKGLVPFHDREMACLPSGNLILRSLLCRLSHFIIIIVFF